jgi:hypothetical protein
MVGLRDAEVFRIKSIELQGVVLDAFEKAIEAREAYGAQAERIRALETELADLKAWGAEKLRYEMKEVCLGATAYVLKADARGSEPIHWLCARCYQDGKKSLLQRGDKYSDNAGRMKGWECPVCKTIIYVRYDISPGKDAPAQ